VKTWKPVWKVSLKGLGVLDHSAYRTRVNIETNGDAVTIWGNETMGRYVEMLEAKTGKMVGHKVFRRE
jgi:hypothetical protein